jgi:hypothetical protein
MKAPCRWRTRRATVQGPRHEREAGPVRSRSAGKASAGDCGLDSQYRAKLHERIIAIAKGDDLIKASSERGRGGRDRSATDRRTISRSAGSALASLEGRRAPRCCCGSIQSQGLTARAELHSAHPGLIRFGWSSNILS